MIQRSQSGQPSPDGALASSEAAGSQIPLADTHAANALHVAGTGGWTLRRGSKQLTRFIADGTGRTDAEVRLLIVAGAVPLLVASTAAAFRGLLRLADFLAEG
jgi:hypothetical protein